jgi:oligoendopeptidase F
MGGLDNLLELLHETGHAVHIAAIRTRPAFTDWPDSDIFTEGIADLASLELYEPRWQQRYIGASVPLADSIVAKYAGIAMDVAWALFEIRMHRAPDRDPNQVWTEICSEYFRIRPHPDLAWWAVRGQLIDAPGYMMNYAAGAILVADLRARARELYGDSVDAGATWYARVSESLFRFGLERNSRDVIEAFLGRMVSPQALLDDMKRAMPAASAARSWGPLSADGSRAGSPRATASRSRSSARERSASGRRTRRARIRREARSS